MESKLKIKKSQGVSFISLLFVMALLFAFAIAFLVISKGWSEIKTPLDEGLNSAIPSTGSDVNVSELLNNTSSTTILFDKMIPFLIIGLFGFVLIIAGFYADSPITWIVGIIILAVSILLGVVYSNVYHQISSTNEFASTTSNFQIQDLFMHYLPIVMFILAIGIGAAILWAKKGGTSSL